MNSQISDEKKRRSLATEGVLKSVVQRLTERGIIEPEEAEDMFALLAAVSGYSVKRMPLTRPDQRRRRRFGPTDGDMSPLL